MSNPQDDKDPSRSTDSNSTDNPFVLFRRWADDQAHALFSLISSDRHPSWGNREHLRRNSEEEGSEESRDQPLVTRIFDEMEKMVSRDTSQFQAAWENAWEKMEKDFDEWQKGEGSLAQDGKLEKGDGNITENWKGAEDDRKPRVFHWSWQWPPKQLEKQELEEQTGVHLPQDVFEPFQRTFDMQNQENARNERRDWELSTIARFPAFRNQQPSYWRQRSEDLDQEFDGDFFLSDPYSPLTLERQQWPKNKPIPAWGTAFDELLQANYSGRIFDPARRWDPYGYPSHFMLLCRETIAGVPDSLARMQLFSQGAIDRENQRTVDWNMPANMSDEEKAIEMTGHTHEKTPSPTLSRIAAIRGSEKEANTDETELDMYEHVLGKPSSASTPHQSGSGRSSSSQYDSSWTQEQRTTEQTPPKPSILSTLTTTEKTTLPDGTITTKVMLKKSFSDGREESSESVHTAPPQQQQSEITKNQANGRKGGGWFWSN